MTRYLLDTNIISEPTKPQPSSKLLGWLSARDDSDLFISALSVGEIWRGICALPIGRRRRQLDDWFNSSAGPVALFRGRVIAFSEAEALVWADIMARSARLGRPRNPLDMIIAATAITADCVVATANERDFENVAPLVNPMK